MTLATFLAYVEYRLHYIRWCLRYPQLRRTNRFYIARRSRLRLGPGARVQFGSKVHFMHNFTGDFYGDVTIGDKVYFQHDCHISVHGKLTIGDYALFGEGVSIHDENHIISDGDDPIGERGFVIKPVSIGKNVWVGAKATILPGVHIGDNAVIGANSVVTHNVPAYTVAGGVPARVLREIKPAEQVENSSYGP
jgi:acetyltransferase-like isoleucine patch superfamily enzyme